MKRQVVSEEVVGERPVVVFLNGCAMSRHTWHRVVPLLPDRQMVLFDRPGMDGTPWPGAMPTLADEVSTLVDVIGQRGPAVLVAHSMAAFHAEALARIRPDLVRGLILVDPSVEWLVQPPSHPPVWAAHLVRRLTQVPPIDWSGHFAHRIGVWAQSHEARDGLGRQIRKRLGNLYRSPDALAMCVAEFLSYRAQAWDLQGVRRSHPWPQTPGVILSALDGEGARLAEPQARLGRLLGLPVRRVGRARHLLMLDRPQVVADAIKTVGG